MDVDADVAVVGAGAAGLSLALRLARPPLGARRVTAVLLAAPPGPFRTVRRTWCYWESGPGPYDEAVTASWQRLRVRSGGGRTVDAAIAPLRYKMLDSEAFEALAGRVLSHSSCVTREEALVERVESVPGGAVAHAHRADGTRVRVRARWVFDSRPPPRLPPARTTLLQHFRGWFVRTRAPQFDPAAVELMDFRTPQPPHGLSFGYVLPTGPCEALVEYTEFSRGPLGRDAYDRALRHYLTEVLGAGAYEITATEQGVIPMTDGDFPRRTSARVFRVGAAAGATRPATGYTFSAVQRQTLAVAAALHAGRHPLPPRAHSARSRLMDSVLLHALDHGRVDGPAFFTRLFSRVPAPRLLRFLDGRTSLPEDLSIGLHVPVTAMLGSALALPFTPRRGHPAS
ncbi:lycopene cyclase family protein [Streptomyces sp. AN091965]|uniref:lycopene cyclase family protein n=1 Tax=Streptomyces sp. AN091965 TaxID=2927803 RepID=UPI001F60D328|nr:lycopene cyclase family protein [Streptomyces sp. AN091965]MCI3927817.1 lycopene cyclase family protein [Streptomyces sp. AN091965]